MFESPDLFLHVVDRRLQSAGLRRMHSESDYGRSFAFGNDCLWVPLRVLLELHELVRPELRARTPQFIFMTDYCCSTLLVNALRELGSAHVVSEPHTFASLANARRRIDSVRDSADGLERWQRSLQLALTLSARTYTPGMPVVVKEWPLVCNIFTELVTAKGPSRALFLYSDLDQYLASMLKDEGRRRLIRHRARTAFSEVDHHPYLTGIVRHELSDAQAGALQWLLQVYGIARASQETGGAIRSLNCARLLEQPAAALLAVARHLGVPATSGQVSSIADHGAFTYYSKGPLHGARSFSGTDRSRQVQSALHRHADEIRDGLTWAEAILKKHPLSLPDALSWG